MADEESDRVLESVKDYYGKVLQSRDDLKTGACISPGKTLSKHIKDAMALVHVDVESRYYGCGLVIPEMLEDTKILDLGSGSGRDCFILSKLVGEKGQVTGLDMTDEQLDVANKYIEYHTTTFGYKKPNVNFVKGFIEKITDAGLSENFFDIVISNCVLNLSPDKRAVLRETFKVLKVGGELYFSDVYCDRELDPEVRKHEVLWGECIAGALDWKTLFALSEEIGFSRPRLTNVTPVPIEKDEFKKVLGDAKFCSATYRLFKLPTEKKKRTNVVYNGEITANPEALVFDHRHTFKTQDIKSVDGELATILSSSRFCDAFDIQPPATSSCCGAGGCPDPKDDPFEFLAKKEAEGNLPKPACCSSGPAKKCC
ncbi:hypothetical protein ScPMuIL_005408 [Solemya velum]